MIDILNNIQKKIKNIRYFKIQNSKLALLNKDFL